MESQADYWRDLAALDWMVELGADEAISETPVCHYDLPAPAARGEVRGNAAAGQEPAAPATVAAPQVDAVAAARIAARAAFDLGQLAEALALFPHCEARQGARNTVFADGNPKARVMVIGEAPDRDGDLEGRPFVGRAGQLLDRMFLAIGLSRTSPDPLQALYITNVMPWRPPANRDPSVEEIAMMRPFVERHIALADPDLIVLMGNTPCKALLDKSGISRFRGNWTEALGKPVLPMLPPTFLLRNPASKAEAWADLLSLKARLGGGA